MTTACVKLTRALLGVLIFSVICGVVTKLVVFPDRELMLYPYPSSMRIVESRCWIFCQRVTVDSGRAEDNFRACLYDTKPTVGSHQMLHNFSDLKYVSKTQLATWAYYLDTRSSFSVYIQHYFSVTLNVIVIQGEQNYRAWVEASYSDMYVISHKRVTCFTHLKTCRFNYEIKNSDDVYYFVVQSETDTSVALNTQVIVSSYSLNTSNAKKCCYSDNGRCEFDLAVTDAVHTLAVSVPQKVALTYLLTSIPGTFDIKVSWVSRIWVYVVLFGAIPVAFVFIIAAIVKCAFLVACKESRGRPFDDACDEYVDTPSFNGTDPPPYSNTESETRPLLRPAPQGEDNPPAYNDVISSQNLTSVNNDPPPPYR